MIVIREVGYGRESAFKVAARLSAKGLKVKPVLRFRRVDDVIVFTWWLKG